MNKQAAARREVSVNEVLAFGRTWRWSDQALIVDHAARLGVARWTVPPGGSYFRGEDRTGRAVMFVSHATIDFPDDVAPSNAVLIRNGDAGPLRAILLSNSKRRARNLRLVP